MAAVAGAGPEAFTLDPVASTLTVSGTLLGQPFVAQNPGSLTTGYTGTLAIERVGDAFTLTSDTPDALNQLLPLFAGLLGVTVSTVGVAHAELMIFGGLIVWFLIVDPHGLAKLWSIGKQKARLWPFPH